MLQISVKEQTRLLEEAELAIIRHYTELNRDGMFKSSPGMSVAHLHKDDEERKRVENEELNEFIGCAYGMLIPRKVITLGHKAPFDFVADLFYERVKNALGFANRNGGKTMDVAILNHLDMLFKQKCEIASAGAVLDQANKCYRYFKGFNDSKWFSDFCIRFQQATGRPFVMKTIQSWTEFKNGSTLEVITGSEKGLRSPHPHKARIDEVDLIDWSVLQTGLSMARSDPHVRGQNVFTSTRQLAAGSMQKLLDTAEEKGIEVYEWDIWEAVAKCERACFNDPVHGNCPIYSFCQGKAHHCAGFYLIDDFIDKVRIIDRSAFETEWENKRPSRHKLVYHQFDNTKHVMTPQLLFQKTGLSYPSKTWHRVGGLDFGSAPGHPFIFLNLVQFPTGEWMVFTEYVAEQRLLRDHANAIKSSPMFLPGMKIYADWDAQDRLELKSRGVRTAPAKKDVQTGIDYIGEVLSGYPPKEEPVLYVWYECTYTMGEFGSYSWPVRPDGKVDRSGNPQKLHDHCMDALRYALFSQKNSSRFRYRSTRVAGL